MTEPALHIEPQITLAQLLAGIAEAPPLVVSGIAGDSREVGRGDVFLACQGATHHGLAFLGQALGRGAAAVLWDGAPGVASTVRGLAVPVVEVPRLAHCLGDIANRFFRRPSLDVRVAGVTGTNGKTTVAWLLAGCMEQLGRRCAYIGTLGAGLGPIEREPGLTTPACIELHRALAGFRDRGADAVALEVSSHAVRQNRIDGVHFDSALFTNLSRDHIDYHGDMEVYGAVKAGFVLRADIAHHVVNVDSAFGRSLAARCGDGLMAVSTEAPVEAYDAFVRLRAVDRDERGTAVEVAASAGQAAFRLPLAGQFNVANAALVLGQLLCWKVSLDEAVAALGRVAPPPGRMQRVAGPAAAKSPAVYVDYAHTPAGLEAVLQALRPHCAGELWCVFGCGGDRDRGKRRAMGETVAALADRAVVTSDNPRSEPPAEIVATILEGMDDTAVAIEDRGRAIAFAIEHAGDDDVVLIAGKGHESFQVIGDRRLPFSDEAVARARLGDRLAKGTDAR